MRAAEAIVVGEPAVAVAAAARMAARAGLVEAFGHVSHRHPDGGFVITSTEPLLVAGPEDTHRLDAEGRPPEEASAVPLEVSLHAAIYAARPDIEAIVRTHSPACVAVGVELPERPPPVTHGLGGISGEVAFYDDPQLIDSPERGAAAGAALNTADCLILRGNGALATGPTLPEALVRAWYLEERMRVWLEAGRPAAGIAGAALVNRSEYWPIESARAWAWLAARFGEG